VIAGMGWVVANRDTYDIGVLNLSFGLDTNLPYFLDPLDAAAEAAWASGITVVAAAGNSGAGSVTAPGDDPFVISVGATDTAGTITTADDTVPAWSSHQRFFGYAKPDVVAPGVSVVSLRSPGSTIDLQHPDARVGTAYFRGTGTSMSAAMVSGAVATLLAKHGDATPDDVKGALVTGATSIGRDAKVVDLAAADRAGATGDWWQRYPVAFDGLGRGWRSGMPWTASRWRNDTWTASRWRASRWTATRWKDADWTASRWKAADWAASDWTASRWKTLSWTADTWASQRWG
jgi:serine protease AprX